jgi:multiple sugar transport system ATP-binding protein
MASIALRDVWKKFKDVQALEGLDFETKEGELFCLLGPSGAGKTTTLRVIAGVEKPEKGDVLLDGNSIVGLMPRERDIALAFESYALYPQLNVFENLMFPLQAPIRKKEYSEEGMKNRVKEVAELLNISELLDRFPRELSGGQRQRVGLGRVLVRKPKAYLLDEPISHLDAKLRHRMRAELKKIQTDLGITTIYSTPDQLEALTMADTIAVINFGKVEQIGSPDEVFNRPKNTFVARFVGDPPMNILATTVESGMMVVDCDVNFQLPVPANAPSSLYAEEHKGKVLVGIRPKDIRFVPENAKGVHTQGRVRDVDSLGQTSIVIVMVGCLEMKVKVATSEAPERESLVSMVLDTTQPHYFNASTKCRLD